MLDAIHNVHRGRRHVHGDVAAEIALHVGDDNLSGREIAVLRFVAEGKANKEIGHAMSLSEETVKAHLKNIFAKLDVSDRTHAVTVAARRGIIEL
jgi:DNA-binding NarL/FixJ family response regulator